MEEKNYINGLIVKEKSFKEKHNMSDDDFNSMVSKAKQHKLTLDDIHYLMNKEKVDANHEHLEKVNGRLRKAENNITAIKTTGTTLAAIIGAFLTWLGLK